MEKPLADARGLDRSRDRDSRFGERGSGFLSLLCLGQRDPCRHGCELFVLPPRWSERSPEFTDPLLQVRRAEAQHRCAPVPDLALPDPGHGQRAVLTRLDQDLAVELAFRGVDQGVRPEGRGQAGQPDAKRMPLPTAL